MRRPSLALGGFLAALTSIPLIALFYMGEQLFTLPFFPFDLFDWLSRVMPGDLIHVVISGMVALIETLNLGETSSVAKRLEQLQGLGFAVAGAALLGVLMAWLLRKTKLTAMQIGAAVGVLGFFIAFAIEISLGLKGDPGLAALWLLLGFAGWGIITARWLGTEAAVAPAASEERRRLLVGAGGVSLAATLGMVGLGTLFANKASRSGASQPLASQPTPSPAAAGTSSVRVTPTTTAASGVVPVTGTRPELTANRDFYRIDINTRPVVIEKESWALEVAGLFDQPLTVTLDELMAYPAVTQPVTMGCISNRVGGDLIGTSEWTGVRLADLLKDWGIKPEAQALYIEGADGFYESVVLEDMMDPRALLVYGMNGETLPVEHGFPLRIYIPNRYGMKQPKWITRIEARAKWEVGYWVVRGWSKEARPQIVSVIDTMARDEAVNGVIPVGGIAWAGDRGIASVEVQVDDGPWETAQLKLPTLSPLTWVIWRYEWAAPAGRHTLRVRATDGTGALQTEHEQGTYPDGATGYHELEVAI